MSPGKHIAQKKYIETLLKETFRNKIERELLKEKSQ